MLNVLKAATTLRIETEKTKVRGVRGWMISVPNATNTVPKENLQTEVGGLEAEC